ncbi:ABC transporter substrate-binding protein [Curvibacter sp. HBC61]|uniref:ABC transporter substrate-binding protein n=1 Tax=Curvibacter cyanobacteriorum TaxID=3026422 RepID=A0ABT5N0N3_9BURK|nr:ABC transporter substrate-binding protein [Curvibacter sp. HBC61]MDD0838583.1 ABC transporter substrate-binding protein [Curvibacter sp. HBC61]
MSRAPERTLPGPTDAGSGPGRALVSRRRCLAWGAGAWAGAVSGGAQAAPARLVTLGGALTEVVYALSAQGQLVGSDTTSTYPDAALRTAKVGYLRQLSAEGLLSLRPEVVLGTSEAGPPAVLDQVRQAGVRVELVPVVHQWREVRAKVELVGQVTGRAAAASALWQRLEAEWAQLGRLVARRAGQPAPRALFVLAHAGAPQVAGRSTAADAVLGYAGATNVMTGFEGYRPLNAEALAAAAPEVLVTTQQGLEAQGGIDRFWQRPEWAVTPAFARRRLVTLEASHLLGFGPRLPSAVLALHQGLVNA